MKFTYTTYGWRLNWALWSFFKLVDAIKQHLEGKILNPIRRKSTLRPKRPIVFFKGVLIDAIVNVAAVEFRFWAVLLVKKLIFDKTYKKIVVAGSHFSTHGHAISLFVVFTTEWKAIECESLTKVSGPSNIFSINALLRNLPLKHYSVWPN